jgi:hypothetical protein
LKIPVTLQPKAKTEQIRKEKLGFLNLRRKIRKEG